MVFIWIALVLHVLGGFLFDLSKFKWYQKVFFHFFWFPIVIILVFIFVLKHAKFIRDKVKEIKEQLKNMND